MRYRAVLPSLLVLCLLAAISTPVARAETSALVISEVLYDVQGADDGYEWVELYNGHDSPIELCEYTLAWGGTDYNYGNTQLEGVIAPGQYFVIGGPTSDTQNANPQFDLPLDLDPDVQNSGSIADAVALFWNPTQLSLEQVEIVDAVIYGEVNSNNLLDENYDGEIDIGDAPAGQSIGRLDDGTWQIQFLPDPETGPLLFGAGPPPPSAICEDPPDPPDPAIEVIPRAELVANFRIDFSDLPSATRSLEVRWQVDGIVERQGISIGERLDGQELQSAVPDELVGVPNTPLTPVAGQPGQNLALLDRPQPEPVATILFGVTPGFYPASTGEGAVSLVFHQDQSELGIDLFLYSNQHPIELIANFFRRDGSLLDSASVTLPQVAEIDTPYYEVTFRRIDGAREIAAMNLVTNDDHDGPGIEALTIDECQPIPGRVTDLRVAEVGSGSQLHLTWTNAIDADEYVLYQHADVDEVYFTALGTAASGSAGMDIVMPSNSAFFLVAGRNSTCGVGSQH